MWRTTRCRGRSGPPNGILPRAPIQLLTVSRAADPDDLSRDGTIPWQRARPGPSTKPRGSKPRQRAHWHPGGAVLMHTCSTVSHPLKLDGTCAAQIPRMRSANSAHARRKLRACAPQTRRTRRKLGAEPSRAMALAACRRQYANCVLPCARLRGQHVPFFVCVAPIFRFTCDNVCFGRRPRDQSEPKLLTVGAYFPAHVTSGPEPAMRAFC